jgi:hypothetical protein
VISPVRFRRCTVAEISSVEDVQVREGRCFCGCRDSVTSWNTYLKANGRSQKCYFRMSAWVHCEVIGPLGNPYTGKAPSCKLWVPRDLVRFALLKSNS